MGLFAKPSRLDGGRDHAQVGRDGQVGELEFFLSGRVLLANEPGSLALQMLLALVPDALRGSIGRAHADRGEAGFELALRAGTPGDGVPLGIRAA